MRVVSDSLQRRSLLRLHPARPRLKEYLRKSLYDCGWHDELKAHCKGACMCGRCGQRCLIRLPI